MRKILKFIANWVYRYNHVLVYSALKANSTKEMDCVSARGTAK